MTGEPSIHTLRRRAKKVGLRFEKSNWRKNSIDNHGGFQVVEIDRNVVVDGARYDLELSAVADIIKNWESA